MLPSHEDSSHLPLRVRVATILSTGDEPNQGERRRIQPSHSRIYGEVRDQFRSQFRQAGFLGKIKIFLEAIPFLGDQVGGNEEWAVETLQRPART